MERQIAEMNAALEAEAAEVQLLATQDVAREDAFDRERAAMAARRGVVE